MYRNNKSRDIKHALYGLFLYSVYFSQFLFFRIESNPIFIHFHSATSSPKLEISSKQTA